MSERLTHGLLVKTGREVLQGAPQLYIDADAEFDGGPGFGSLLSLGSISPYGETFYIEIAPDSDDYKPKQRDFCEEHGLERARLLKEGVPALEAIGLYGEWTIKLAEKYDRPPKFVAFNPWADFGHVDLRFARAGLANPYGDAPFDLKSWAQGLKGDWDWRETSKVKLPTILVPPGDFTHNALEDSIYQQEVDFASAGLSKLTGIRGLFD